MPPASPSILAAAQPVLPQQTVWVGVLLIAIAALFLSATVIGPIVKAHMRR